MSELFDLIARERLRAAEMIESLDEAQLATPSLCGDWTVRDLAGHLVVPFSFGMPGLLVGMVKAGGRFDVFNSRAARELGRKPVPDLVETLRRNAANRFTPPGHPPAAPLTDIAVHTRDAARPLGLGVSAPLEVWRHALDFLVTGRAHPAFVPRGRLAGLRLVATDQEWSHGDGAEVAGPSEALALGMLGRTVALAALSGDGVTVLRGRR